MKSTRGSATKRAAAVCLTAASLNLAANLGGAWYLQYFEEERDVEVARERERLANLRKLRVMGDPLEGNAATRYRRAFASIEKVPPCTFQSVRAAAEAVVDGEPDGGLALSGAVCEEAVQLVRDGLRCTHCDWELGYDRQDPPFTAFRQARMLADCLTIAGHERSLRHDSRGAVHSYLEVVAFGAEFGSGDLTMNLAGITIAQLGLEALGQLILSVEDDARLFSGMWEQVAKVEGSLPSIATGIKFARLRLAGAAAAEARRYVRERRRGISILLPWRGLTAWRLSRDAVLLSQLERVPEARDARQRDKLSWELKSRSTASTTSIIREGMPDWLAVSMAAKDLLRFYRAVQVAIRLQEWRAHYGRYPEDASVLGLPLDSYGLRYEGPWAGARYRLWAANASGCERGALLLESGPRIDGPRPQ